VLAQRRSSANRAVAIGERGPVFKMTEKLPNGRRLSCGAKAEGSQTECYHSACRMFSGLVDDGRRQLQARVRLLAVQIPGPASWVANDARLGAPPRRENRSTRGLEDPLQATRLAR